MDAAATPSRFYRRGALIAAGCRSGPNEWHQGTLQCHACTPASPFPGPVRLGVRQNRSLREGPKSRVAFSMCAGGIGAPRETLPPPDPYVDVASLERPLAVFSAAVALGAPDSALPARFWRRRTRHPSPMPAKRSAKALPVVTVTADCRQVTLRRDLAARAPARRPRLAAAGFGGDRR